jgi:hypothetical protein
MTERAPPLSTLVPWGLLRASNAINEHVVSLCLKKKMCVMRVRTYVPYAAALISTNEGIEKKNRKKIKINEKENIANMYYIYGWLKPASVSRVTWSDSWPHIITYWILVQKQHARSIFFFSFSFCVCVCVCFWFGAGGKKEEEFRGRVRRLGWNILAAWV